MIQQVTLMYPEAVIFVFQFEFQPIDNQIEIKTLDPELQPAHKMKEEIGISKTCLFL